MSSPTERRTATEPLLELDDVTLRYPASSRSDSVGLPALDGVTIRIDRGERVAVVGPSGAGKSSIISLANTSLAPTAGMVRLFGVDPRTVRGEELRRLRRRVATVHQHLHLAGPLRVIHNVNAGRLGAWSTWRALRSLIRPLEVDSARAALAALGIDDKIWVRTDRLSGGERQRVAIARLMVQGAEFIVADEPISSLDPARGREVLDALCSIADDGHRGLLVSLHAFEFAVEYFDRIVGMRAGRILFDLPADAITPQLATDLYRIEDRSG